MKGKCIVSLAVSVSVVLLGAAVLWADQRQDYRRPDPLMDYVSQEMGVYDTLYWQLDETDCRGCHGSSLADTHHSTDTVIVEHLCTPCHDVTGSFPGVVVIRDCWTSGCHSLDDVETNGWHHSSEDAASGNCIACHDPMLIGAFEAGVSFEDDPPEVTPPTPYACENCHWTEIMPVEGGKPIYDSFDTHHMEHRGNVKHACYMCHGLSAEPVSHHVLNLDPDNPERIRHCQKCHPKDILHAIHDRQCYGWEAVADTAEPDTYRLFTEDEMCAGCHGATATASSTTDRRCSGSRR